MYNLMFLQRAVVHVRAYPTLQRSSVTAKEGKENAKLIDFIEEKLIYGTSIHQLIGFRIKNSTCVNITKDVRILMLIITI